MASKRKSTVPSMIPSKSKHMREDIVLGCLPELLPTIPEDSILSISTDEDTQRFHDFSKPEEKSSCWKRGTYSCPLCCFDSGDLNLFLNHMDNCHMDFHAQPNFYCLPCKVAAVKFEDLALHNAKSHPELHNAHRKVSLKVAKRDGAITVEQNLFTEEDFGESGISITKTPIMKMTKGGHKKIVISHTVEVQRAEPRNDKLAIVTNGTSVMTLPLTTSPQIFCGIGAPPMHKIPNIPEMHNRGPLWNSNPSFSESNSDLPKVMIPLSSIPTYDPAMDLSSFLKTSFGKFPYPTKAELCYLTVVSGFPEEQIKLWFTAQRLKQGISWSPEEIEDTRRKMFNTVFQAAPKTSQNQSHHQISQHCVSVPPACLSSSYLQQIPKGSVMGWKGGVIVSQPNVTQATSLKQQQPVVQASHVNIHHAPIPKETGNEFTFQTAENCNVANRGGSVSNHGYTGKSETGCSTYSKTSVSCLHGKSQSSSFSEGSIMNLTNIVRKINCHVNDRSANCTSKSNISSASIYGQQKASSNTKESSNSSTFATTSKYNNGSTYKSTSHSTICTKRDGNMLENTSKKSNTSDTSVICSSNIQTEGFIPPLLPQPGSLIDPSLRKGKLLPELPATLKQSFIHNSFPEQKQVQGLPVQNQPYVVRTLIDTQSALAGSFSNVFLQLPTTSSLIQEELNQHSSPSVSAPQEQTSPKTLLGAPQVQSPYKVHDPKHLPALDKDAKLSAFDAERLHSNRNVTQKESEELTKTFYTADEHSKLFSALHTFPNMNTNKKQEMPHIQQYMQDADQWECSSSCLEESNRSPVKINVIALNKEERLYKTNNSKQLKSKPSESWVNDGGPSHKNEASEWQVVEERVSDISYTQTHQPDSKANFLEFETVKLSALSERKSIFQSLDSEAPALPRNKKSKETLEALDKSSAGEQDYWEIKHEERQQPMANQSLRGHQAQDSQSRDCLRGELLKV
ncbi:zinc fingers and homeoboxes protein 3 [Triplophysa rosa]|uniref:Homeobox domain-containing protein n=1 Tax=Triplophysa rosa TaxID=992332 RepID=A0A9W7TEW0_TRIRA|nr:zinc fingers and homeoboxes protein 3 [Triplophysa rosa]KAI7794799.1 hypothetical protein IRJ41_001667 [Triplophysa rosa]